MRIPTRRTGHRIVSAFPLLACTLAGLPAMLAPRLGAQAPAPAATDIPADRKKGAATIDPEQIRGWLTALASPEFGGRGTGQYGFKRAADFMRDHFSSLGLEPGAPDGTFFQPVPWTLVAPDQEKWKFSVAKDGEQALEVTLDQVHGHLDSPIEANGEPVVAIVSDLDDFDFEATELTGTVLFLLVTDEGAGPRTRQRGIRNLLPKARKSGAGAVFLADSTTFDEQRPLAGAVSAGSGRIAQARFRQPNFVVLQESRLAAIAKALGQSIDKVRAGKGTVRLGGTVTVSILPKATQAPAYNVIAYRRGSDPKLRDEFVVIGCHLDHLGDRNGRIYPGADDDGSGSAGLMALAQAFAKNDRAPRRSVMFTAFCGEEMGLIGSGFFAKNPPIPLAKIVAELQIDMIGRNETGERGEERAEDNENSLHLIGTKKLSRDLHDLCLRLNSDRARFDLEWDEENVFYRSDHWNFARYGVPIAFFFTGFHQDYHRPTDTVEKINFPKLARIARYVYDIGFELADAESRPLVDGDLWEQLARKGSREPAAPVRQHK